MASACTSRVRGERHRLHQSHSMCLSLPHPACARLRTAGMAGALGGGSAHQQRLVAERKWRLGMHARGHPSAIMAELFRVLQVGAAWMHGVACAERVHAPRAWRPCGPGRVWLPSTTLRAAQPAHGKTPLAVGASRLARVHWLTGSPPLRCGSADAGGAMEEAGTVQPQVPESATVVQPRAHAHVRCARVEDAPCRACCVCGEGHAPGTTADTLLVHAAQALCEPSLAPHAHCTPAACWPTGACAFHAVWSRALCADSAPNVRP